jgi:hypothetical protein
MIADHILRMAIAVVVAKYHTIHVLHPDIWDII